MKKRRTKTMMNFRKIRSIKDLQKRKLIIKKKSKRCERQIDEDVYSLTHPIQTSSNYNAVYEDDLPFSGVYKIIRNIRRLMDIAKLGSAIFMDYRRK